MGKRTYSSSSSSESDKSPARDSPYSFEGDQQFVQTVTVSVVTPEKPVQKEVPFPQRIQQEKSLIEEQELNLQLLRELRERESQNSFLV